MENQNLYIVTGGPGSGKTAVLSELQRLGFRIACEVARQIIQEQVTAGGEALPWKDRDLYTRVMLQRSIDSFLAHTPATAVTFADRGIPDTLCYAQLIRFKNEGLIRAACDGYRYARRVFFAPPWREIYTTDSERKQDFAEAEHTAELLLHVYRECGYEIIELPKTTPQARAQFMMAELQLTTPQAS